jgi:hypothetical protein
MSSENASVVFVNTIPGICASGTSNHFWNLTFLTILATILFLGTKIVLTRETLPGN